MSPSRLAGMSLPAAPGSVNSGGSQHQQRQQASDNLPGASERAQALGNAPCSDAKAAHAVDSRWTAQHAALEQAVSGEV